MKTSCSLIPSTAVRRSSAAVFALAASVVVLACAPVAGAASSVSGVWQDVVEKDVLSTHGNLSAKTARQSVLPREYRTLRMDREKLSAVLAAALPEGSLRKALAEGVPAAALPAAAEIELPIPHSDRFARFSVESSPVMDPALAARFPDVRTYTAQGIDEPELSARLDVTLFGFHALIFSPEGQIDIDPYFLDGSDPSAAIAFYKKDYVSTQPWTCGVGADSRAAIERASRVMEASATQPARPSGASLRVYRLVIGTTGEYSAAVGGGDLTATLAAVVTTINRVDALYERDFAIRMVLVANEDKMIYTNASTDPYTNGTPNSLLSQNQSTCTSVIGSANYDIGHVFSTAGGGLAGLGVVCKSTSKAQGETGTSNPIGDPYDIDYVAHEMGHQFGANHTFNSSSGSCGGNGNPATAFEPGSGTTIMAYAGICSDSTNGVQDLAPHSDDYFHTGSYTEIDNYTTTGSGKNVVLAPIATGNTPPAIVTPTAYTIPLSTPFALTASASDANGDRLTYCWEEYDVGAYVNPTGTADQDNGASPIFRTYPPTANPTRFFPSLAYILNNANVPPLRGTIDGTYLVGEALPSKARAALTFRCTVRDNHVGGGGSDFTTVALTVSAAAGPFAITAPNTAASYAAGAGIPVTWNVANTTASPVSCANVKISLSTDGGLTFPYMLAASVPNSGSAMVTLPATATVATTQARIKVEAVGNIFFDIDDANFTITSANTPPAFSANSTGLTVVRGTPTAATATVGTATAGTNALSSVSVSGLPDGATVTGSLSGGSVVLSGTAECRLTTTLTTRTYPISVTVTDAAGATGSATVPLVIKPNLSPTLGTYANTSVAQSGSVTATPSAAPADGNGNLIAAPLSVSPTTPLPTGVSVAFNPATGAATFTATSTATLGTFNVRVQLLDSCGAATEKLFTLTVTAPITSAPAFTNATPASPTAAGTAYSYTFTASGSPAPAFAVTAGTLPPGLSLNGTTGVLAGTPTTPGVYSGIQVTASNGTAPNATQTFSLTVTSTQASYAASYGLTGANAVPGADPDHDGLTNLGEYAFNLNPNSPDVGSASLPASTVAVRAYAGGNYLSIRFTRVPLATDITYIVETSPDLTSGWTTVATSSGGAVLSGAGVVTDDGSTTAAHTVEVRDTVAQDAATAPKRFIRVRITQP